jgi:hypothetical protein
MHHNGTIFPERPEAGVNPENLAFDGSGSEDLDQAAAQAIEKGLGALAACMTLGLSGFGIGKDDVHIGGKIHFPSAQLAHSNDHKPLRLAAFPVRDPMGGAMPFVEDLQGLIDQDFGQTGQLGHGLLDFRTPCEITPCDSNHLSSADSPKSIHQVVLGCYRFKMPADFVLPGVAGNPVVKIPGLDEILDKFGMTDTIFENKIR